VTVQQIVEAHVFNWLNATAINAVGYYVGGSQLGLVTPYTYIIDLSGSTYRAWHGANSTLYSSGTNASAVIAAARAACSGTIPETIYLKGNLVLTTSVLLKNYTTYIIGGKISAGANITLFSMPTDEYVQFSGVVGDGVLPLLYGNMATYTANAVNFSSSEGGYHIDLKNLRIQNFGGFGVRFEGYNIVLVNCEALSIYDVTGEGFYTSASDSTYKTIYLSYVNDRNIIVDYAQTSTFYDFYLGGQASGNTAQFYVDGAGRCEFDKIRIDNPASRGCYMIDSPFNTLSNWHISNPATSDWAALVFTGASQNNTCTNIVIDRRSESYNWTYGLYDEADYNLFTNFVITDCSTEFYVVAAHSSFNCSLVNGTFVP